MDCHGICQWSVSVQIRSVFMPTYYVTRCKPLALPLGELSPQVTERALQPFTLSVLAALGHLSQGERQGMRARDTKASLPLYTRLRPQARFGAQPPIGRLLARRRPWDQNLRRGILGKMCVRGRNLFLGDGVFWWRTEWNFMGFLSKNPLKRPSILGEFCENFLFSGRIYCARIGCM